jgi:hypothetical protein
MAQCGSGAGCLGFFRSRKRLRRITRRKSPTYPDGYEIAGLGVLKLGRG